MIHHILAICVIRTAMWACDDRQVNIDGICWRLAERLPSTWRWKLSVIMISCSWWKVYERINKLYSLTLCWSILELRLIHEYVVYTRKHQQSVVVFYVDSINLHFTNGQKMSYDADRNGIKFQIFSRIDVLRFFLWFARFSHFWFESTARDIFQSKTMYTHQHDVVRFFARREVGESERRRAAATTTNVE